MRIMPVASVGAAIFIIRRFIPLVFARNTSAAGVSRHRIARDRVIRRCSHSAKIIDAHFGAATALTIRQPRSNNYNPANWE